MAEALREERAAYEDVRALRFTLVDERGVVRAALGTGSDGAIAMSQVLAAAGVIALAMLTESMGQARGSRHWQRPWQR